MHNGLRRKISVGACCDLNVVAMKNLGDGGQVAGKVPLCSLGDTTAAPGDQDVFRESTVGVLDFDECELDAAFVEVLNQVGKLTICDNK